jgi:hypothetical protein
LSDHNLFDEDTFGDEPCSLDLELYGTSSLESEVSDWPGLGHKYLQGLVLSLSERPSAHFISRKQM